MPLHGCSKFADDCDVNADDLLRRVPERPSGEAAQVEEERYSVPRTDLTREQVHEVWMAHRRRCGCRRQQTLTHAPTCLDNDLTSAEIAYTTHHRLSELVLLPRHPTPHFLRTITAGTGRSLYGPATRPSFRTSADRSAAAAGGTAALADV